MSLSFDESWCVVVVLGHVPPWLVVYVSFRSDKVQIFHYETRVDSSVVLHEVVDGIYQITGKGLLTLAVSPSVPASYESNVKLFVVYSCCGRRDIITNSIPLTKIGQRMQKEQRQQLKQLTEQEPQPRGVHQLFSVIETDTISSESNSIAACL